MARGPVAAAALVVFGVSPAVAQDTHAAPPPPLEREWSSWLVAGVGSRIGISIQDVEEGNPGRSITEGAMVTEVEPDGPGRAAGIEPGDVIVEFDGERVRSARQLSRMVSDTPSGRTVPLRVVRDGRRMPIEVTPESGPAWIGRHARRLGRDLTAALPHGLRVDDLGFHLGYDRFRPRLGVEVIELSPQLADYFGVEAGVLVTTVRDETAAARAGVRAGDVVTAIDDQPVQAVRDLRRHVAQLDDGDSVSIHVVRDGEPLSLEAPAIDGRRPRRSPETGHEETRPRRGPRRI